MRILHDDWSIKLGENRSGHGLKHLVAMLAILLFFYFVLLLHLLSLNDRKIFLSYTNRTIKLKLSGFAGKAVNH